MLDPFEPAYGHEWTQRLEAAERTNRFAEALDRLRKAFQEHDSQTLEDMLQVLRGMYAAAERARQEQAAAREATEHHEVKMLIVAVVGVAVGVAGVVAGIVIGLVT